MILLAILVDIQPFHEQVRLITVLTFPDDTSHQNITP